MQSGIALLSAFVMDHQVITITARLKGWDNLKELVANVWNLCTENPVKCY
jgi:hypothetical protein